MPGIYTCTARTESRVVEATSESSRERSRFTLRLVGYTMRSTALYLILLLSCGALGFTQANSTTVINQNLRRELLRMQQEDQKYRTRIGNIEKMSLPPEEKQKRASVLWEKQEKIDQRNIKRLAQIIEKYGWPSRSLIGKEGSVTAFLIVQHADLAYQKKYFPLLKEAVSKGEADPDDAALLEDRILMFEGKKQLYGTQLRFNEVTKQMELWPIEDEERVDARRASVGLEPIAEYVKRFGLTYKPPKNR